LLEGGLQAGVLQQLFRRNVERFRGGLVVKAHRLLYHATLRLRVINKQKKGWRPLLLQRGVQAGACSNRSNSSLETHSGQITKVVKSEGRPLLLERGLQAGVLQPVEFKPGNSQWSNYKVVKIEGRPLLLEGCLQAGVLHPVLH